MNSSVNGLESGRRCASDKSTIYRQSAYINDAENRFCETVDWSFQPISRQQISDLCAVHAVTPIGVMNFAGCVFEVGLSLQSVNGNIKSTIMTELRKLLLSTSDTLQQLNLSYSNISGGEMFFLGKEFDVVDPETDLVTLESQTSTLEYIVRDDNPPLTISESSNEERRQSIELYYIRTTFDAARQHQFQRSYARMAWLSQLRHVSLRGTSINSWGVVALTAAANKLRVLDLAGCALIDDSSIYAIVALNKELTDLNLSDCPQISTHAIFYLAQSPRMIQNLHLVDISHNPNITRAHSLALMHAFERHCFAGTLIDGIDPPLAPGCGSVSGWDAIHIQARENPSTIFDLRFQPLQTPQNGLAFPGSPIGGCEHTFTTDGQISLNLSNSFIDDEMLTLMLPYWGPLIHALSLEGTFVTEKGLHMLALCTELRILRLSRCKNIRDKQSANKIMADVFLCMPHLTELCIAETRISGRALHPSLQRNANVASISLPAGTAMSSDRFSLHLPVASGPAMRLEWLDARNTPLSINAVRVIADRCRSSMRYLNLAGCNFMNANAVDQLLNFRNLEYLDLSHCSGLSGNILTEAFHRWTPEHLHALRLLRLCGLKGVDQDWADSIHGTMSLMAGHAIKIVVFDDDWAMGLSESNSETRSICVAGKYGCVESTLLASRSEDSRSPEPGNPVTSSDAEPINQHGYINVIYDSSFEIDHGSEVSGPGSMANMHGVVSDAATYLPIVNNAFR